MPEGRTALPLLSVRPIGFDLEWPNSVQWYMLRRGVIILEGQARSLCSAPPTYAQALWHTGTKFYVVIKLQDRPWPNVFVTRHWRAICSRWLTVSLVIQLTPSVHFSILGTRATILRRFSTQSSLIRTRLIMELFILSELWSCVNVWTCRTVSYCRFLP